MVKVGDIVSWNRFKNGTTERSTGMVVAIVPAGENLISKIPKVVDRGRIKFGEGTSYYDRAIVAVQFGKITHYYCPTVSALDEGRKQMENEQNEKDC